MSESYTHAHRKMLKETQNSEIQRRLETREEGKGKGARATQEGAGAEGNTDPAMYRSAVLSPTVDYSAIEDLEADYSPIREGAPPEIIVPNGNGRSAASLRLAEDRPPEPKRHTRPRVRVMSRQTVPKAFRDRVLGLYPVLANDPAYMRLLGALLSHRRTGETQDGRPAVIIDSSLLASCMGSEIQLRNGDLRGEHATWPFLQRFNADVFGGALEIDGFNHLAGYARSVPLSSIEANVSPEVLAGWRALMQRPAHEAEERVYFDSGEALTAVARSRDRARYEAALGSVLRDTRHEVARRVLEYLYALPPKFFSTDLDYAAAWEVVRGLEYPVTVEQQGDLLNAIQTQPKPFYHTSEYSPRVWGSGSTITGLKSSVRRALMPTAVEFDLASAHFAIAARDWNLPKLRKHLASGEALWPVLLEHMGLPTGSGYKRVVKAGGYGIVYGAGRTRIIRDVRAEFKVLTGSVLPVERAERLLTHPFMEEALAGRERELEHLKAHGWAVDCYGELIREGRKGYGSPEAPDYSRSILAQLNQARELWLMEPILALAEEEAKKPRPAWRIVLWQHDGVSIKFMRRDRMESHAARIKAAVEERARSAGYPTRLESS